MKLECGTQGPSGSQGQMPYGAEQEQEEFGVPLRETQMPLLNIG